MKVPQKTHKIFAEYYFNKLTGTAKGEMVGVLRKLFAYTGIYLPFRQNFLGPSFRMKIIDSHCHLDDFFYDGTINEVLENAERALVTKMIAVGTHGKDWQFYSEFVKSRGNIFYTVGLHPLLVSEHLRDIELLGKFLGKKPGPVAIGEIGLDYHRLPEDQMLREAEIKLQQRIFREQLASGKGCGLPVVIHSRQAFDDTLSILLDSEIPGEKIVFHCYDYGVREMEKLKEFGAFVSFSGMLTYKKSLVEPLKIANPEKILLETDCPYLTPQSHKPNPNEPAYIRATAELAAKILNMQEGDFCNLTYENTEKFFGINQD